MLNQSSASTVTQFMTAYHFTAASAYPRTLQLSVVSTITSTNNIHSSASAGALLTRNERITSHNKQAELVSH